MMRKRNPVQPRKTMLIVTSNPALAVYFSRVRKDCRYVSLTVECQAADSLEDLIKVTAKRRIAGKYSSAWAVFTFDDFGIKAGDVNALTPLADSKKVKLGWTNPSLSLWLFLHLKPINVYVDNAASFDQAIAKVFPGYQETEDFMSNEGKDIHLRLFSSFSTAVLNASSYNKLCEKATGLAATSFPLLYENIKEICGEADLSHNQKLLSK